MFDLTSRITYKNVSKWHRDLLRIVSTIPIVLVGNKADDPDRKVRHGDVEFHKEQEIPFFEISCLTKFQYELPILHILRSLIGDQSLSLAAVEPESPLPQSQEHTEEVGSLSEPFSKRKSSLIGASSNNRGLQKENLTTCNHPIAAS